MLYECQAGSGSHWQAKGKITLYVAEYIQIRDSPYFELNYYYHDSLLEYPKE